ncbi:HNH endonuclease signature motif containing protein [Euzebya pacifica]|uniref:HNH endonuclease signature motif containing protein n=1 Tax=Euzebya pacifica TaxID=1608957 RepID=UPI001C1FCE69|nr:HNH endonuclease signature motif containing protein [Euzebya pacifica]
MTELVTHLHTLASRFDPDQIPDGDVAGLVVDLGRAGRLVDGMLTRAARRATETSAHETTGVKDAATLIATATGTSTAAAKKMLKTSSQLVDQPDVDKAVTDGTLSTEQAVVVSETVADAPEKASELIGDATSQTLPELRKKARDIRTAADPDRETTRRRHLTRRAFRSWTETDGEWKAFIQAPGDLGARIEAALRGEHDAVFRTAHAAGQREDDACYRFDALLNLLEHATTGPMNNAPPSNSPDHAPAAGTQRTTTNAPARPILPGTTDTSDVTPSSTADPDGTGPDIRDHGAGSVDHPPRQRHRPSGRQTKVIIRVDGSALVRGELADGETCEIAGIGQVALSAVREQIPDAHITYVITNATDVTVAHLGRQVTAHQRTALEARGYCCEVPGCAADHLLEIDHVTGWAITKDTRLSDLAWLCTTHHRQKSRRHYRLLGPPGQRTWTSQTGAEISRDPPAEAA